MAPEHQREGWIAIPAADALTRLAATGDPSNNLANRPAERRVLDSWQLAPHSRARDQCRNHRIEGMVSVMTSGL